MGEYVTSNKSIVLGKPFWTFKNISYQRYFIEAMFRVYNNVIGLSVSFSDVFLILHHSFMPSFFTIQNPS